MDEGLRITVGNDVFYEKSAPPYQGRPRSPRDELRAHLPKRPDPYPHPRLPGDRRNEMYGRPPPDPHREEHVWIPPDDRSPRWSPRRGSPRRMHPGPGMRPPGLYGPPDREIFERKRYSRSPDRRLESHRRWSPPPDPHRPRYEPEMRRHSPDRRRSPSPHRHSPPLYRRRSPSPHRDKPTRSRYRRHSSSDSNDSREGRFRRSHSNHSSNRVMPAEDLLISMFSRPDATVSEIKDSVYLHQSLDKSRAQHDDKRDKLIYDDRVADARSYTTPEIKGSSVGLNALSEAYANTSPPPVRRYDNDSDDEEKYLYGDGNGQPGHPQSKRYQQGKEENRHASAERKESHVKKAGKEAVTPGGFDSNALKNVLKAIGFDFELSAQSLQKAANKPETKDNNPSTINSTTSIAKKETEKPVAVPRVPYQQPMQSKPRHQQVELQPRHQQVQLQPRHQQVQLQPRHQQVQLQPNQLHPGAVATNQGAFYVYPPPGVPFPPVSLPLATNASQQLLYQPGAMPGSMVPYIPSAVPQHPNLKEVPIQETGQESPKKAFVKSAKTLEEERKARKKRLDYLEVELENLKKKQKELIKKKKRQLNVGDQELMHQNSLLQAGVEKQIKEIRDAAERAAGIKSKSESSASDDSSGDSSTERLEHDYVDGGNHFCRECNITCETLVEFLSHLHTKGHKKLMDPSKKPWYRKLTFRKMANAPVTTMKGPQFLLPINGYYCKLCRVYIGDHVSAEEHLRTELHNQRYLKYCKKHPEYEKQQHQSSLQTVADRLKKLKDNNKKKDKVRKDSNNSSPLQQQIPTKTHTKETLGTFRAKSPPRYSGSPHGRGSLPRPYDHSPPRSRDLSPRKHQELSPRHRGRSPRDRSPTDHRPVVQRDKTSHSRRSLSPYRKRSHTPRSPPKSYPDRELPKMYADREEMKMYGDRERPKMYADRIEMKMYADRDESKMYSEKEKKEAGKRPTPKRRFYEDSDHKPSNLGKKKKHSRWSPGYDDFEKIREKEEEQRLKRELQEPKQSSTGTSFGKFTWKKIDKGKGRGQPPAASRNPNQKRFSLKITGAPSRPGVMKQLPKQKSGLSDRVSNFAPHTVIKPMPKDRKPAEAPKSIPTVGSRDRKALTEKSAIPVIGSTNASNSRNAGAVASSNLVHLKMEKEPPPPGTEDMFQDEKEEDNRSDVSGISMEIGSDEEG